MTAHPASSTSEPNGRALASLVRLGAAWGLGAGLVWAYQEALHLVFAPGSRGGLDAGALALVSEPLLVYGVVGLVAGGIGGGVLGTLVRRSRLVNRAETLVAGGIVLGLATLWGGVWVALQIEELRRANAVGAAIVCVALVALIGAVAAATMTRQRECLARWAVWVGVAALGQLWLYVALAVNASGLSGLANLKSILANLGLVAGTGALIPLAAGALRWMVARQGRPVRVGIGIVTVSGAVQAGLGLAPDLGSSPERAGPVPTASESLDDAPNVVLIVIDTLRADHLSGYGYARETSPTIDALARRGVIFENAHAPSSWTRPSVGSYMTSLYPSEHGAVCFPVDEAEGRCRARLAEESHTLAEYLSDQGFYTVAFVANPILSARWGDSQGFDEFHETTALEKQPASAPMEGPGMRRLTSSLKASKKQSDLGYATASEVTDAVLHELSEGLPEPFLMYVHYMDPHTPYRPPEPYRGTWSGTYQGALDGFPHGIWHRIMKGQISLKRTDIQYLRDRYDEEILYVDSEMSRLLGELERRTRPERNLIVVLSDHGEEFADHGYLEHGFSLHREVTNVPLIWAGWGVAKPGRSISQLTGLVDLLPTLAEAAGTPLPGPVRGRSRWKPIHDPAAAAANPPAPATAVWGALRTIPQAGRPTRLVRSVRVDRWTLIWNQVGVAAGAPRWRRMLFDRESDPSEQNDVYRAYPDVADRLDAKLVEIAASLQRAGGGQGDVIIDPATRRRLRALGYID